MKAHTERHTVTVLADADWKYRAMHAYAYTDSTITRIAYYTL